MTSPETSPSAALDLALTESRTLRAQHMDRTDALDKVKAMAFLPDGVHLTTEMVGAYYEVSTETINKLVQRNRAELTENGLRSIKGAELRQLKIDMADGHGVHLPSNISMLNLFIKRTALDVGQMLTGSPIAKAVRTYLLNLEELAPAEMRQAALGEVETMERKALQARLDLGVIEALGTSVDPTYRESLARHRFAVYSGTAPEIAPENLMLMAEPYLIEQGLTRAVAAKTAPQFGKKAKKAYFDLHGFYPQMERGIVGGRERPMCAYFERDRPLLDAVFAEHYAHLLPPVQLELSAA